MICHKTMLAGATAAIAIMAGPVAAQDVATPPTAALPDAASDAVGGEIIVTAQKRQENIQNVGISIQAATGENLIKLGITDTSSLQKIVPGFLATPTYSGTTVFSIRGVGFQDTSLAGSPTVSVYLDEAPLPFSALTNGATLDLQRVEVLKGPQGTLFGNNATGGAVNYIANKPTDRFEAGTTLGYGRFNDADLQGYVSGPVSETLDARLAVRFNKSGAWQKGYYLSAGEDTGGKDLLNGRLSFQWKPGSNFTALLTLNGWRDKGYNQIGQLYGIAQLTPVGPISPLIANYPLAPHNDRAADFNRCVNNDPFDPIANQASGAQWLVAGGHLESQGPGSAAWAGGQPLHCQPPRKDNYYYSGTLRLDYDLGGNVVLTSLSEYQHFHREAAIEASAMAVQDYQTVQRGRITSGSEELRLAGKFGGHGNWVVGANYEHDKTRDNFFETPNGASAAPVLFAYSPALLGLLSQGNPNSTGPVVAGCGPAGCQLIAFPLGPNVSKNRQTTNTYAAFASVDYRIFDTLSAVGGVRYTQSNKRGGVCVYDGGDGTLSQIEFAIQQALGSTSPKLSPPGTCATAGLPSDNFNSPASGYLDSKLNQHNISWRAGLNWQARPRVLIYANVSKGYKSGAYPSVALSTYAQANPARQESLLAYEAGIKSTLFDRQLTLNVAGFYYDYSNKQILGSLSDILFGALPALVNIPKSHVIGFELSGIIAPSALAGLTITPSVSYQQSKIDTSSKAGCAQVALTNQGNGSTCVPGHFYGFDSFNQYADFTGERFPQAPQWQASVDAEYDWKIHEGLTAFVGGDLTYSSSTNTSFVNRTPNQPVGSIAPAHPNDPLAVPGYALLDLRAGIERGPLSFQIWGRNVTNKWYWRGAYHFQDVLQRYTGMPVTYGATLSFRYR